MVSSELLKQHNLTDEEYGRILQLLGREPNLTELGIFSVMWSEHCSYKSSRVHLKNLPTRGPQVVQGPGENAGIVDIGNGLVAVFKIESHNHPSFIEPYQGAATGVGGIIRDIFTMGARPIALMNSLRFGNLTAANGGPPREVRGPGLESSADGRETAQRNQMIMEGVVAGIAGYGNCIGIPTVGGEVFHHPTYDLNPLVNVFCLGTAPANQIFYGRARGTGNPVIYVGAKTGRDGIHGATMASAEFNEDSKEKRPTVQVGDPFMEKLLLEACLEAMQSGAVLGIQDMGAAGLTCSTCEMGSRGGTGIDIDLSRVPQREAGMVPYEIMLSESQERMLLVAERGRETEVLQIFKKWDLDAVVIGTVTDTGMLTVRDRGEVVAQIPNSALTDEAPAYHRPERTPSNPVPPLDLMAIPEPQDYNRLALDFLASANLCSRKWIFRQYDHMVQTNTCLLPGHDAAVVRIKDAPFRALAMTVDGNPRYCAANPKQGAILAVAEACRNLACVGALPLAATNCLNFASPENPEVMWQFRETVEGLREACEFFKTPITGGNVSFYNETNGRGIHPSPVLGIVGTMDYRHLKGAGLAREGDTLFLLGETLPELGASEYAAFVLKRDFGPVPAIDLVREQALQRLLQKLASSEWLHSVHDCSNGGLLTALLEKAFLSNGIGWTIEAETPLRPDVWLFSESQSRAVISCDTAAAGALEGEARQSGVPCLRLGTTREARMQAKLQGRLLLDLEWSTAREAWAGALENVFKN